MICAYNINTTMGNCLDCLFGSTRSALRHESLISHRQLTSLIRQSTLNDHKFYSSSNLVIVEQYLNSLTSNSQINTDFVNKNLDILHSFIKDLRDKYSELGRQYLQDVDNLRQQAMMENKDEVKNDLVVLRVEVQIVILGLLLSQLIEDKSDWELLLQITQALPESTKKQQILNKSSSQIYQNNDLMLSIKLNQQQRQHQGQNMHKIDFDNNQSKFQSADSPTKIKTVNKANEDVDLIEIPIFMITYKIVNKNSRLAFNLWKEKKNNAKSAQSTNKTKIGSDSTPQKLTGKNSIKKSKVLLGHTSLSVSDFIYYNSLMISDVISLHSPNEIKSSITTSASNSSQSAALISIRGQGIQGETFEKDYIRIIKQHETVAQQLQLCLEGQKAWERLSLFKQSSQSKGSQKNESIYSEYSMPQDNNMKYKL